MKMKFEVVLKRKGTINQAQNIRCRREEVFASSREDAEAVALSINDNRRYFVVESVRRK